MQSYTDKLPA